METAGSLVKSDDFSGKYVAVADFATDEVVASGDNLTAVFADARERGFDEPVVFFVPDKNLPQLY